MSEIRVIVVDDHAPTRELIVGELSQGGLIKIVAEAQTSDEALKLSKELLPDIVLLDLHLPGLIGTMDLLKRLSWLRNVKIVLFASSVKPAEVQGYFEAGAAGCILKTDPAALVRMALLMVSRGSKGVVSPSLPRQIINLTERERLLLHNIAKRAKLAKALENMDVSEDELLSMVNNLTAKLELESPDKLMKWARKQGF